MKKRFISLFVILTITLTACSGSEDSIESYSDNKIVGTWESSKEVTDSGDSYPLNENNCPLYIEVYNNDGSGSEKNYANLQGECELIYSYGIKWQSLGNNTYKISNPDGSFSDNHQYTFIDEDTFIQRDEENESNIYFKRKIN